MKRTLPLVSGPTDAFPRRAGVRPGGPLPDVPIVLDEIDFYVTMKCNLNCDFCSVSANEYDHEELSLPRILELMREAKELGMKELHFSGGEPTLRDDLEDMIAYAEELGLHTRIITNGFKLDRERIQRLHRLGLDDIMISVDGFEKTHDVMRGNRFSFDRALRVVRDCVDLGIRTRVSTVIYRENMAEAVPLLLFFRDMGVHIYSFFLGSPLGRGYRHRMGSVLNAEEWRNVCNDVRTAMREHDVQLDVVLEQGFQYEDGTVVDRSRLQGRGTGCATLMEDYHFLILRADGNLYQCVFFVTDGAPIGNVKEMSIKEALLYSRKEAIYEPFTVANDKCVSCSHQVPCGTGCRGYAYLYENDWLKTDPRCAKEGPETPKYYPLCPILKVNAASGHFGGSTEQALRR